MLATQIKQRDFEFFFLSMKAKELLENVRFTYRYYLEEGEIKEKRRRSGDIVSKYLQEVERTDRSFQRPLKERKVKKLLDYYKEISILPPLPSAVILATKEPLNFEPLPKYATIGDLQFPTTKFYIVDGQHRLAALKIYIDKNESEADNIYVPTIIFHKVEVNTAAELFVNINYYQTRITKSHIYDLLDYLSPKNKEFKDLRLYHNIAKYLYKRHDSILYHRIDLIGNRSGTKKWIIQADFVDELKKYDSYTRGLLRKFGGKSSNKLFFDYFKATEKVFQDIWDNDNYMLTSTVVLRAILRAFDDILKNKKVMQKYEKNKDHEVFYAVIEKWKKSKDKFKGPKREFFERFPAGGPLGTAQKIYEFLKSQLSLK